MGLTRFVDLVLRMSFPGLTFEVTDQREAELEGRQFPNRIVYQLRVRARLGSPYAFNNTTGKPAGWTGRWWRLSEHMTDGEVVQTAFKAILTALEHEARERFTFDGVSVLDPHYDIHKLVALRREEDGGVLSRPER